MSKSKRVDDKTAQQIDAALAPWRQGDIALDTQWFVHAASPQQPLTEAAAQADAEGPAAVTAVVKGLVILTQTCDLIRSCLERPYVEVAPLVEVDARELPLIKRGWRPRYASIPRMEPRCLVADLDRVMTVEKSITATWARTAGWTTDAEARWFAESLARKRARFAFPDEFTALVKSLRDRLTKKRNKQSEEGGAIDALREIRIIAAPSWDEVNIDLMFWFILDDAAAASATTDWPNMIESWRALLKPAPPFKQIDAIAIRLADMTAQDYVDSDPLDLDHLTMANQVKAIESSAA